MYLHLLILIDRTSNAWHSCCRFYRFQRRNQESTASLNHGRLILSDSVGDRRPGSWQKHFLEDQRLWLDRFQAQQKRRVHDHRVAGEQPAGRGAERLRDLARRQRHRQAPLHHQVQRRQQELLPQRPRRWLWHFRQDWCAFGKNNDELNTNTL